MVFDRPRPLSLIRALAPVAAAVMLLAQPAWAEPPAMKENASQPRLEVASKDGRYSVALGGFLQARYTASITRTALDVSEVGIPRTRLYVYGHLFSRNIRYRLMLGTLPFATSVELYDAYVEWWARPWARLRGGVFKVPALRTWVDSARLMGSVERAPSLLPLLPGRRPGLLLSGGVGRDHFEYWLGVFGSGGTSPLAPTPDPTAAARIVWNTQGRSIEGEVDLDNSPLAFSIGASATTSLTTRAAGPRPRELLGGLELAGRHRGFDGAAEVAYHERSEGPRAGRTVAGYVRGNYFVPRAYTAFGGRVAQTFALDNPTNTRTHLDLEVTSLIVGHDLKIQLRGGPAYQPMPGQWFGELALQVQAAF